MRLPAVAGMFYPDDPKELLSEINSLLNNAKKFKAHGKLRGLIVPHAGYVYSGIVAAAGYRIVKEHSSEYDDIILIGPSHYVSFYGAATVVSDVWETPLGPVQMYPMAGKQIIPLREAHEREHSLEVQIPFLQVCAPKARIFPLVTGDIVPESLAQDVINHLTDRTLVIVSSDLSHYYPYDEAVRLDSIANDAIPKLDVERVRRDVEACGKDAILVLMHVALKQHWRGELIEYKNSGDTAGDKDSVVGYGCYGFFSE